MTTDTDCLTCENARTMYTPDGWIPCPHCRYEIKCDECKVQIGRTDNVGVSAAGGLCFRCALRVGG